MSLEEFWGELISHVCVGLDYEHPTVPSGYCTFSTLCVQRTASQLRVGREYVSARLKNM